MSRVSAPCQPVSPRTATRPLAGAFWIAGAWAVVLAGIFFSQRGADVARLPAILLSSRASGVFNAVALRDSALGALVGLVVVLSWLGIGNLLYSALDRLDREQPIPSRVWRWGVEGAWGAGVTSLLWFFLGILHLYTPATALIVLALGLALFARRVMPSSATMRTPQGNDGIGRWTLALALAPAAIPILLAGVGALAPPTAKDSLMYHIALPKAFLAARGLVDVPGNIAQFYALGAELNGTWAMLLGRLVSLRAGEAAFGCTEFAYLLMLALIVCGWCFRQGLSKAQSLVALALVTSVPTVYSSAASGYNDLALTVYITLGIAAVARWWSRADRRSAAEIGLAIGFALGVKLLALFLLAPAIVVFLLRIRQAERDASGGVSPAAVVRSALLSILLALAVASPWYVRNWARTGSPIYPFYLNVVHGSAPGWGKQRSYVDQVLNSRYGGYPKGVFDYLAVPVRASLTAQPDIPRFFDGVLGISFLFGLPLLLVALAQKRLDANTKIAAALAGAFFVFWLFSSEQLRYLLPALPALAVVLTAAAVSLGRHYRALLLATVLPGLLVIAAWFAQQNPLAVVIGTEQRSSYLQRMVDHYPIYETVNTKLPANARVWLIDMRRDTYYIERPYFSDFRVEDYTFVKLVDSSDSVEQLRDRARQMGITYVLARTDLLLDPALSPIVEDKLPAAENERHMEIARSFLLGGKVIRREDRFVLVEL